MRIEENEIKFILPENVQQENTNDFTKLESKIIIVNLTDSYLVTRVN
mgnify:CR=1 FL=1